MNHISEVVRKAGMPGRTGHQRLQDVLLNLLLADQRGEEDHRGRVLSEQQKLTDHQVAVLT
ncbi:hypothetical protein D3C80_1823370 [compost metagenome]